MKRKLWTALLFLLLLSAFFVSLPMPVKAIGENWLTGWSYRKSHVINNATGANTNYQIPIIVVNASNSDSGNTTYISNKTRTDFGDVRFTDDDGSTLLDYWMETSFVSINATFWVEIADSLESVAQTIYIYYGKADTTYPSLATDLAHGVATFPLFDNFEDSSYDTAKWNNVSGTPVEANGYLRVQADDVRSIQYLPSGHRFVAVARTSSVSSGFQIGSMNLSGAAEFTFYTHDYYQVYDGAYTQTAATWSLNTWYRCEYLWIPSNFATFYRNNSLLTNLTGTNVPDLWQISRFLSYSNNPTVDVGVVFVAKFVNPEPSHGAWGSEETPLVDTYYVNYSNISQNSTMIGTSTQLSVLWLSNGTLVNYIFEWNFSGSWVADGSVNWDNTTSPQWSNITKSLGTGTTKWHDTVQWRINATAQDSTLNNTGIQSFTLTAILVNYQVPDTGTLKINGTQITNSTHSQNWLADSYDTTPLGATYIYTSHPSSSAYSSARGQTFNYTGSYGRLSEMTFWLKRSSTSPSGHLQAYLYAHTGTFGTSGLPTGNPLAASSTSLDVSTLTTTYALYNFSFTSGYPLTTNQKYCAVLQAIDGFTSPSDQYVWVGEKDSSGTHNGNPFRYTSNSWNKVAMSTADIYFYVYVNSPVIYQYDISLSAESLPGTGYSFYNFTQNSVYYNNNPSTVTFSVMDFMVDYDSDFTMVLGIGGGLNRIGPASLAEIAVISLICIPAALIILLLVLRRRR